MWPSKSRLLFVAFLCATKLALLAQSAAPLPSEMANAKKIFLLDAGSNGAAFDAFAAAVKQWNRYKVVPTQEDSDLVFQFRYKLIVTSQNVWTSRSLVTGNVETVKTDNTEGELSVLIFNAKTKDVYATLSERSKKKKDRDVADAARRLAYRLQSRIPEAKKTPGPETKSN